MINLNKTFTDFLSRAAETGAQPATGVAQSLLEQAGKDAGRNPIEAAELRDAARAFLSVVR